MYYDDDDELSYNDQDVYLVSYLSIYLSIDCYNYTDKLTDELYVWHYSRMPTVCYTDRAFLL